MEFSDVNQNESQGNGHNSAEIWKLLTGLLTALLPLLVAKVAAYAERKVNPAPARPPASAAPDLPKLTELPDGER